MVCQHCGENPATFHLTNLEGGTLVSHDFCEACATALGHTNEAAYPSMLASVVAAASRTRAHEGLNCPHCGITFSEFRRKGRFGCPMDYEVFHEPLEVILRKVHVRTHHRGRLPSAGTRLQDAVGERLLRLRRQLNEAVEAERYEEAARMRDEIQAIESARRDEPSGFAGLLED
jgi:protein arginine kinase activator